MANAGDGSISTFRLNDEGLERIAVTEGVTGCSTFAVDGDRNLVYAAVKPDATSDHPGILTLALDRETGALTPRSRRDLPGGGMNYLALSHGGTVLLGASYGGGYGISASVADGVVSEPVSQVEFRNLHSVLPSADGRFAYFVSLGDDVIAQYGLGADARLDDLGTVAAPEGSGPRHLVLNAAQDAVYVLTEFSGEVLHYSRDTESGALALEGAASAVDPSAGLTHSRFGADPVAEHLVWGADLHVGDGVLWASERSASTLCTGSGRGRRIGPRCHDLHGDRAAAAGLRRRGAVARGRRRALDRGGAVRGARCGARAAAARGDGRGRELGALRLIDTPS